MISKWLKKTEEDILYILMEYFIAIYAILATVVNVMNMMGITQFHPWFMKNTFFGSSQLVLLLLQYGFVRANRKNEILNELRPYVMGLLMAGVVSADKLPLCYILLLVLGYFLISGFLKKYGIRRAVLMALVASTCIEIYSTIGLFRNGAVGNSVSAFLQSPGPDILFVLSAIAYGIVVKPSTKVEMNEADPEPKESESGKMAIMPEADDERKGQDVVGSFAENNRKKHHKWKQIRLIKMVSQKLNEAWKWVVSNPERIVRCCGGTLCVFSIGLFMYYALSVGIGVQKISMSTEEVYLLQHCGDPSLVLTAVETENPDVYSVSFERYEGKNSQKVFFQEVGENLYQIVFLESGCALDVNEEGRLYAAPATDALSQWWVKEMYGEEQMVGRLFDVRRRPLHYSQISENKELTVFVGNDSGEIEVFCMERTVWDEFATCMVIKHYEEFKPTILLETIICFFDRWVWLVFILIVSVFCATIYLRRIIGDKLAALYGILFLYMLAYESISIIGLLYMTFGIQCYYAYILEKNRRKR